MAEDRGSRADGGPDGRGHGEGSKPTRFAAGDGRKRPGRPKGAKSLKTIYLAAAAMPITVEDRKGRRRVATVVGIVMKQREKALKGDQRAAERFLDKVAEHSPVDVEPDRTGALLAEDAEILASARARGLLPPESDSAQDEQ